LKNEYAIIENLLRDSANNEDDVPELNHLLESGADNPFVVDFFRRFGRHMASKRSVQNFVLAHFCTPVFDTWVPLLVDPKNIWPDGCVIFDLFGARGAPYEVVFEQGGPVCTSQFLQLFWQETFNRVDLWGKDQPLGFVEKPSRQLGKMIGTLFGTVVSRQKPLHASQLSPAKTVPKTFLDRFCDENIAKKSFEAEFQKGFLIVASWKWFMYIPEEMRLPMLFADRPT
jgi:hypothetical protein